MQNKTKQKYLTFERQSVRNTRTHFSDVSSWDYRVFKQRRRGFLSTFVENTKRSTFKTLRSSRKWLCQFATQFLLSRLIENYTNIEVKQDKWIEWWFIYGISRWRVSVATATTIDLVLQTRINFGVHRSN